jgi:hypothetical protein
LALGTPRPPLVLKGSHQLFLLRVDRDHGISAGPEYRFLPVDVSELRIPVGVPWDPLWSCDLTAANSPSPVNTVPPFCHLPGVLVASTPRLSMASIGSSLAGRSWDPRRWFPPESVPVLPAVAPPLAPTFLRPAPTLRILPSPGGP